MARHEHDWIGHFGCSSGLPDAFLCIRCDERRPACTVCGTMIDPRERSEGGDEHGVEVEPGRWTCSFDCWSTAIVTDLAYPTEPFKPAPVTARGQSRIDSFMEAITNTTIGFVVALITWQIIAWAMGIPVSPSQSLTIVTLFTVVSIARSYLLRRLFDGRSPWRALKGLFA